MAQTRSGQSVRDLRTGRPIAVLFDLLGRRWTLRDKKDIAGIADIRLRNTLTGAKSYIVSRRSENTDLASGSGYCGPLFILVRPGDAGFL